MANTTNFGWETPDDTDLVKDGAASIRTLGSAIDTSMMDLKGGTTGQVLSKNSNTDMDFIWVTSDDANAIQNAIVDAKGDLITATAADTPARLAVGSNGQVLTADSTTATGLKWAAAAGGGKVLQVVSATNTTAKQVASTTYADTNLTASITPSAASSKILVLLTQAIEGYREADNQAVKLKLMRDATTIFDLSIYGSINYRTSSGTTALIFGSPIPITYLDSPNTTSSVTYKTQGAADTTANTGFVNFQPSSTPSSIILLEIGA